MAATDDLVRLVTALRESPDLFSLVLADLSAFERDAVLLCALAFIVSHTTEDEWQRFGLRAAGGSPAPAVLAPAREQSTESTDPTRALARRVRFLVSDRHDEISNRLRALCASALRSR